MLKARPRVVIAIATVITVGPQLLSAWLGRAALNGATFGDVVNDPSITGRAGNSADNAATAALVIQALASSVLLPFVAAALAYVIVGMRLGQEVSAGEALRRTGRRSWALLVGWLLVHAAEGAGSFAFVGGIAFMTLFTVTAPAIALEELGPINGMRRSWRLVSRRFFPCLGVIMASALVSTLLRQALGSVPELLAYLAGDRFGWVLLGAGRSATTIVVTSFVAATSVLLYLDLRVRTEGLDLELAADAA